MDHDGNGVRMGVGSVSRREEGRDVLENKG